MHTIRDDQMRILTQSMLVRFQDLLAAHLRRRFPAADFVKDPEQLEAFVEQGVRLARRFGVVSQFDMRRFLEFRAEYGADFHKLPWAAKILNDSILSGCGKMEQIDAYSLFALRRANE